MTLKVIRRGFVLASSVCLAVGAENTGFTTVKELLLSPSEYSVTIGYSVERSLVTRKDGSVGNETNFYFGRWQADGFYIQGPSPTEIAELIDHREMPVAGMSGDLVWFADALAINRSEAAETLEERAALRDPVALNAKSKLLLFLPLIKCGVLPLKIGTISTNENGVYIAENSVNTEKNLEFVIRENDVGKITGVDYFAMIDQQNVPFRVDYSYNSSVSSFFPSEISTYYLGSSTPELTQKIKVSFLETDTRAHVEEYLPEIVLEDISTNQAFFSTVYSNGISYFLNASGNLEPIQKVGFASKYRGLIILISIAAISTIFGLLLRKRFSQ